MNWVRLSATAAACTAGAVLVSSALAAEGVKPVDVKGRQIVVNQQKGRYRMEGSLVGGWNMTAFKVNHAGIDGRFVGSGKELFRGCLDTDRSGTCQTGEPTGTLRFSFVYWATYKPGTTKLMRGQCVHPVIGGTGGFAKATGVIHMTDVPTPSGVRTTYRGTLAIPGISTASIAPSATRVPASVSRTASSHGCGG
jgi:hypothetical protein